MKEVRKLKFITTLAISIFSILIMFLTILAVDDEMQISIKDWSLTPIIMIILSIIIPCIIVRIAINRIVTLTKDP